jgi:hypothetical protein
MPLTLTLKVGDTIAVLKVGWLEKFKLGWLKNFQPAHVKFPASRLP